MVALDQRQVADFSLPGPGRHPAAFAAALATRPAKAARARGPPTLLLRPHDTGLSAHMTLGWRQPAQVLTKIHPSGIKRTE